MKSEFSLKYVFVVVTEGNHQYYVDDKSILFIYLFILQSPAKYRLF